jgi:L-lactate dehydrogenase complex protein LldG
MQPAESGDREAFLAGARARLAGGIHLNPVHVPPEPTPVPPTVGFTALDPHDLVGTFIAMATAVDAEVHPVAGDAVGSTVVELARRHGATSVVRTPEPDVGAAAEALARAGLTVEEYTRGASADLGLTGAVAAVAATGSIVLDSGVARSRAAGVLPPVHVCILSEEQLVATPADVLLPLSDGPPSSFVLVGGPSRTGDVEQILTLGVHGPRHVHIILVRSSA